MENGRSIDRLIAFVEWCKQQNLVKNDYEFENICGLGRSYLYNMSKRTKGSMGSDVVAAVKKTFPMINLDWLIIGEGDMLTINPIGGFKTAFYKQKDIIEEVLKDMESAVRKLETISSVKSQ